jgi:hypothetical protein
MSLADRRNEKFTILMYDNENNMVTSYISQIYNSYRNPVMHDSLGQQRKYILPARISHALRKSAIPKSIKLWNALRTN